MLDEVKKLIKEQKIDQAVHQIDELLLRAQDLEEQLELLTLKLKISNEKETREKALEAAFKLERFQTYLNVIDLEDLKSSARHYQYALCLYKVGSLHRSFQEFSKLTEKCFKHGYVQILKKIIDIEDPANVLGEVKSIGRYYHTLRTGLEINTSEITKRMDEKFFETFNRHSKYFKHQSELYALELKGELKENNREQFIKHSLEYLAINGKTKEIIALLSEYAIRYKCINLGHELSKWNPEIEALFPERAGEEDVDFGDIDSAEDLFDEDQEEGALIRGKVNALISLGQPDQARILLKNFLESNPKSELRQEYQELLTTVDGTRVLRKNISIDSVMENLVRKISRSSGSQEKPATIDLDQRSIKSYLSLQDDSYLIDNFRDLVSCFIMLEFYEASLWLIESVLEKAPELEREARFLRCDIYLMCGKHHYCLDETLAVWNKFDLDFDEEIEILYKRAECYRLMGKRAKAIDLYREVLYRDGNYRLAKLRLQEFE